jgi:hypothetical protein
MGHAFAMSISKGWMHLSILRRDMLDNVRGNLCRPSKYCKNEKIYCIDDVLRSHLMKHEFVEDYRCWNKHGEEGLNQAEMIDSYLEREVPISAHKTLS